MKIQHQDYIDVTGVKLEDIVQAAYACAVPVEPRPKKNAGLSRQMVKAIVERGDTGNLSENITRHVPRLRMSVVLGRHVVLTVYRGENLTQHHPAPEYLKGKLFIRADWKTPELRRDFFRRIGVECGQ